VAILESWSRPKLTFGGAKAVRARKNTDLRVEKCRMGVYLTPSGSSKWKSHLLGRGD
jgi:hypothetical protein